MIGIKTADGNYFPIFEETFSGTKKTILSGAKKNQDKIKINFFKWQKKDKSDISCIGTLLIEDVGHDKEGGSEIELKSKMNGRIFTAEASDTISGEKTLFCSDISLPAIQYITEDISDINISEKEDDPEKAANGTAEKNPQKGKLKKIILILVILFLILVSFLVFTIIKKPAIERPAEDKEIPAPVMPVPGPKAEAPEPAPETPLKKEEIKYKIKQGDTLWDISETFYKDPWLYGEIAEENNIKNPDLIYPGKYLIIKHR